METGVVLTATELEGVHPASDWSLWVRSGRAPTSQGLVSFTDSWQEDLEQLAGLGISAIQITLEWAALEPRPGAHDATAVEFRRDVLSAARDHGLDVWACLIDGTLPGWFADDEGGFVDDRARSLLWPRHVDWIGEHFGDLVHGWVPQREAISRAIDANWRAAAPPGGRDATATAEAVRAAILADGEAWRLLRGTAPVATYQTARLVTAAPDDVKATAPATWLERLLWHSWLHALGDGEVVAGALPPRTADHLRDAFDRVIVELRPAIQIDGNGTWHPHPADATVGPTGWAPWPEAAAEALLRVADELGDRAVVAAGNLADVADDGNARPDHQQALCELTGEAAATTSVMGWWQSSPIDGYHWRRGGEVNPGVVDRQRVERPEAQKLRVSSASAAG
ncbi:MAG: family 1 glycosylhydrolase [Actinomycetota bacterium]